ncbi:AtpZ/AtpI family protein [Methylobrevis pamukkalensis]|uniref:ATP synthase protein I n=1 Tax=Methylobrevis pamukkalensis TaxID=1439726 RepID=A0A1E3GZG0_9HYPH|nr:AtpZ/AtpI family protein [Methylobrevis pamukkalensis]ODN69450.1 ATP synthase protein I [Methylobrevis pamukkalensis]
MNDDRREGGGGEVPPGHSDQDDLAGRKARLEQTLAKVKGVRDKQRAPERTDFGTNYSKAFRLASEFTGGVLVGAVLGWGFDQLLGTSPIGLVVFLLLGFAAGVMAMVRTGRSGD